jgi:hypothetical protein
VLDDMRPTLVSEARVADSVRTVAGVSSWRPGQAGAVKRKGLSSESIADAVNG